MCAGQKRTARKWWVGFSDAGAESWAGIGWANTVVFV